MVYNFGPGPAVVPLPVLQKVQADFLNWQGTGSSIVELSHRLPVMMEMGANLERKLRAILAIPEEFAVLFLSGGARTQFAAIPLNLLGNKTSAAYAVTGYWSEAAVAEAQKYCAVNVVTNTKNTIAPFNEWKLNGNEAFLHYTDNESISGVEYIAIPKFDGIPTVADITSSLLTKALDFSKLDMGYASAQKNLGIAGLTLVIIRKSLLGHSQPITPSVLDYMVNVAKKSMYNTPCTISWYIADLVLDWVLEQGGLGVMESLSAQKAACLYKVIDSNPLYTNVVDLKYRSRLNIIFNLSTPELEAQFLADADKLGFKYLKGHGVLGGIRASCYNGMPLSGVKALAEFMQAFADKH